MLIAGLTTPLLDITLTLGFLYKTGEYAEQADFGNCQDSDV